MIEEEFENTEIPLKPYYVYALIDPTQDNQIFYIGKGTKVRGLDHIKEAKEHEKTSPKLDRIRKIENQNSKVIVRVLCRFDTEPEAFAVEAILIHWVYGYENLTNIGSGHGVKFIRDINQKFPELKGIDIPKKLKISGKITTGYTQEIIERHASYNHIELAEDLRDYLSSNNIPGINNEILGLENGRYIGFTIDVNKTAQLVIQLTDTSTHNVIFNLKPITQKKADRDNFIKFVNTVPMLDYRNEGRYAKFSNWYKLKLTVEEHREIYDIVSKTLLNLNNA
jgi:hypothetical protein